MKRDEKKHRNRNLVVQAAYHQMTTNGIQNTSLKSISAESGISLATIYKYFANKDDIAEAVALQLITEIEADTLAIANNTNWDFIQKVNAIGQYTSNNENPPAILVHEFSPLRQRLPQIQQQLDVMGARVWKKIIQDGRNDGFIGNDVSDEAIKLLATSIITSVQQMDLKDAQNMIPQMEHLFIYGLLGKKRGH